MSKSLGNTILPQDIIKESGAEIIRLWVAMVDYREEVRLGKQIIARVVEAYRKIRNTLRYLASNLYDFEPHDRVALDKMEEVDRYALARYAAAASDRGRGVCTVRLPDDLPDDQPVHDRRSERVLRRRLEGPAVHVRRDLAGAPLGADRDVHDRGRPGPAARTDPAGHDRRAVAAPAGHTRSVRAHGGIPAAADLARMRDSGLERRWDVLLDARAAVNPKLEALREKKVIGSSLQASVVIDVNDPSVAALLKRYADRLPMLFIVSSVTLGPRAASAEPSSDDLLPGTPTDGSDRTWTIDASPAQGEKCPRCWRIVPELSSAADSLGLCARCVVAMTPNGVAG